MNCRFPSVIRPGGSPNRLDSIARSSLSTTSLLRTYHFHQFWTFLIFCRIYHFHLFDLIAATGTAKNPNKAPWERIKFSSFQWYPLSGMFDPREVVWKIWEVVRWLGEGIIPKQDCAADHNSVRPGALLDFVHLFWLVLINVPQVCEWFVKVHRQLKLCLTFWLNILIIIIVRFCKNCLLQSTGVFWVDSALKLFNWMSRW